MQSNNRSLGGSPKLWECLPSGAGNYSHRYRPWIPRSFRCPWSWHGEWLRRLQFWISWVWNITSTM